MKKNQKMMQVLLALAMASGTLGNGVISIQAAGNRVNFALDKTVTASHDDGNLPSKAVDGDLSTRWGTDPYGSNQWLDVDLEKTEQVDEFRIASENNDAQKIRKFKIEGSVDGEQYTLLYDGEDRPEGYDLDFTVTLDEPVACRYVRITVESLISGAYPSVSLREFEVIGYEAEEVSAVKAALEALSLPTKVYHGFDVPLQDEEQQVSFTWEPLNDAVSVTDGHVSVNTSETISSGLRVTATRGTYTQTEEFRFTVYGEAGGEYDVYPQVHDMEKQDQVLQMSEEIFLNAGSGVDTYVQDYAKDILSEYQFTLADESTEGNVQLCLGIAGSGDAADRYFANIDYDQAASTDVADGYVLNVSADDQMIVILGHDASGVFNGLSTLSQMMEGSRTNINEVQIADAPDTQFRGIVEGFYGEYSHKERLDLISYIGKLKMNTYIYGAKSDAYHRGQWRELYPEDKLAQIRELVECGKKNNVELVWTAHVGGNIDMGSEEDYQAVVKKFDQLYDAGVRQFGLFYDDAGSDNTYLTEFINRLNREYIHLKEGVKNLIVCPQHYNKNQANDAYFAKLAAFDEDVQIMWTGDAVISEVDPEMMDYIESKINRPAYIWWNYPVNDLGMGDMLLVGETVGLSTEMDKMVGLTSNPMLQAQASKFSLFSIADYSWNIADYDQHASWEAATDYIIEDDAYAEAFRLFAANNNQSVAELKDIAVESEYLIDDFNDFRSAFYSGADISEKAEALKSEFKKIEDACALLRTYENTDLVAQITPWMDKLQSYAEAAQGVLDNIAYMNSHDLQDDEVFTQVKAAYEEGQQVLGNVSGKWSGRREIVPFLQEMQRAVYQQLQQAAGLEDVTRTLTNYRNGAYLMSTYDEMLDGSAATYARFDEAEKAGKWVGLDLGVKKDIDSLQILAGTNEEDTAVASGYEVQISDDGVNWTAIETTREGNCIRNVSSESARFVRYYVTEGCQSNAAIREFTVNSIDRSIYTNAERYADAAVSESTGDIRIDSIEDFTLEPGEYIGLQFAKTKKLAGITADEGLSVETSTDGVHWSAYEGGSVNARFARLINHGEETWDQPLQQFVLLLSDAVVPQNMSVEEIGLTTWSGSAAQIVDGNRGTYHWTRDQQVDNGYIVDMKENIVLHDVTVVMGDGDYMEQGVIEASTDKNEWTQIGTISGAQITTAYPEDVEARYLRVRMTKASSTWLKLAEVEVNLLSTSEDAPVLDVEGADAVIDHDLFMSYNTSGSGSLTVRNDTKPYASRLSILKNADGVMKTEVYADGAWHEAEGTGNELVTYDLSDIGQVEQVRISWEEDADLQLYEIALSDEQASEDAPDYSALNEAIAAAEALDGEDYTTNSWNVLTSALETAKTVAADESATQTEIDDAANALNNAKAALQVKASKAAIDALQNVVDKANALQEDSLAELIAAAQALLDDPANVSVTAVVSAMLDLSEAMADLNTGESEDALRADVQATIDFIKEHILNNVEGIRPAKVQALKDAVKAAQDVVNDPDATVDELKAANKAMTKAAQELWEIVSKAELNALIEAANGYLDGDYTTESLEALQAAITAAQTVAANDDATTAEVTEAITNLSDAIANLESITLDTSALEHEIELVTEMIANLDNYVPSSVEGLQEKLDAAKTALTNATTQAEIDEATKTLREARLNARTKADTSALEELIAYVNSLDLSAYTKESAQAVIQEAARAEIMTNDPEITQTEVDDMVKTLQASVDNLVEVKNSTSAEDTTNTAAAAQTGLFAGVLAAAAGALHITRKRRREKSE